MRWPDAEQVVRDWLAAQLGVRACNELPPDLADQVPLVQVIRIQGGNENERIEDRSNIDIVCFAGTRDAMWELTYRMRAAMLRIGGQAVNGIVVDNAQVTNGSGQIPYANPAVRRSITTYRLTCRAQAPA